MTNRETVYRQLVLIEMEKMVQEQYPIRLHFSPTTSTYQQVTMIAEARKIPPRAVIELAVRALFLALFGRDGV